MASTATTTQHTPTPWELGKSDGKGICSIDALDPKDGQWFMVCEVMGIEHIREWSEEAAANAAFIVRACNSHEQLVAALRGAHTAIDVLMANLIDLDPTFMPSKSPMWPRMVAISAALAAAEA